MSIVTKGLFVANICGTQILIILLNQSLRHVTHHLSSSELQNRGAVIASSRQCCANITVNDFIAYT